ncbi:hypothetical protein ACEPAH_6849 [Sanghuangporus vaninii]
MIRRQPTLVALTETDVQDVRDYLERFKATKQEGQSQTLSQPPPSTNASTAGAAISTSSSTTIAGGSGSGTVNNAGRTKEERLGLR